MVFKLTKTGRKPLYTLTSCVM